ncbi:MAG: hypothetical protein JST64_04325 [Actinobacteria bacterium]|nr:hypothetical protein [Actinomycetota bacterium]
MANGAGTGRRARAPRTLGAAILLACVAILVSCSSDSDAAGRSKHSRSTTSTTTVASSTTAGADGSPTTTPTDSKATDSKATDSKAAEAAAAAPHGDVRTPAPKVKDPGTLPGVPFDRPVEVGNGVTIRLTGVQAVQADAKLPGEISGPAVRFTVSVTNGSTSPVGLDNVSVVLNGSGGTPTATVTDPSAPPLSGSVAPGATATGTYTFSLAVADRDDSNLTIKYSEATPTASFTGSLPRG